MKATSKLCLAVVLFTLCVPALRADTITIDGAVFSLTDQHITANTYLFHYAIDTSGYYGPGSFLDSVAVNPSGATILSGSFSGPSGWISAAGNQQGPGGCGGGAVNYWCAQAGSLASMLPVPNGTYDFYFTLTLAQPLIDLSDAHIQASFGDIVCNGRNCTPTYQNQLGISTSLVQNPEPGSLILLGTGLIGTAGAVRRKLRG